MRYILGINAYHADSSACLLVDGKLVAAVEEERLRRVKHWAGFPEKSIRFCLKDHGIDINDIDVVAINTDPGASRYQKLQYVLAGKPRLDLILEKLRTRKRRETVHRKLESSFGLREYRGQVAYVEHHLAHLASAYLVSPYASAVLLSVDGFGDFCSSAWGVGENATIAIEGRVYFPHSLGVFYQALTQFLGFPNYGDEYKVMGLASYGRPEYVNMLSSVISSGASGLFQLNLKLFRHHRHRIGYAWDDEAPRVCDLFSTELEELLGPRRRPEEQITQRHKDIAHSVQMVYENTVFALMNYLHERYGDDRLVLSGGCAMNSVANGKVYQRTPFRQLYVQPAAGDAGGAIGAALVAYTRAGGQTPSAPMDHAYIGPQFVNGEVRAAVLAADADLKLKGCRVDRVNDDDLVLLRTAQALDAGKVVGWFQGRMEWGPRALGNRSILCDPRRRDIKEMLNEKIKRRESFRPFAPSILREAVPDWFEQDDDVPFMEKVFQILPEKTDLIPGVTHTDGTGRLQTVSRDANPRYYDLIKTFQSITGVPILLNTSFNENEPIVCEPHEALDCFLRTNMDVLVLENHIIERIGHPDLYG